MEEKKKMALFKKAVYVNIIKVSAINKDCNSRHD